MKQRLKILVVVDAQNDFITGSLANKDAEAVIPNIVKKIDEFNGDAIFYTKDTHKEDYLETKEGKNLPFEHCIESSWGWQIEPSVSLAIVHKLHTSMHVERVIKYTFGSTVLPEKLAFFANGLEMDIEFIGFCTDICVVSNALMTKARFYETADISVDSSCCAGTTPENHEAALKVMNSCQIKVK